MIGVREQIAPRVVAMEHDVSFWSLFMGEERLFGDLVGYFDGNQLLLFGARLDSREPATDNEIQDIFDHAVDVMGISYFECWRPGIAPVVAREAWTIGTYCETGVPLRIPLVDYALETNTSRERQVRQAKNRGFTFEANARPNLESDDIVLIESFLATKELGAFDIAYTSIVPYFTWGKHGHLFRVKQAGRTVAIGTVSTFAQHVTTFVHTFVDRSARGASDLLYDGIIEFARRRGSSSLDLGYSATKALEDYKRSWGAEQTGDPNCGVSARKSVAPSTTFFHWPIRMLVGETF